MKTNNALALLVVLVVLAGAGYYWFSNRTENTSISGLSPEEIALIGSFEECAAHFPTMESYPPQCTTPDGRTFAKDIGNELSHMDLIAIDTPRPTTKVTSPLAISGKARGMWYFEASFPVELQTLNGTVIAQGVAQAQDEWMTEEFVPYKLTLTFPAQPAGSRGKLVLKKDNPSGEASRDDSLIVPVEF